LANYVKFKQGLKKDFNTTNQPLTNGMIYFVIDENNHGSIYYDTVVDGAQATKKGTVHRVKFSGLPIKITGSVTGTGVISKDGEIIEINTSTNHSHGLVHQDFTVNLSNDDTNLKWTRLGNQNGGGFWLKSIRGQAKAPAWFLPDYSAGIAFGGADTKGIISVRYSQPGVRFAGGNGDAPVWYFTITGSNDKTYDLSKIGGHSSDSAKLDHNVTFKIASTADSKNGGNGTVTDLSGPAVNLYLPTRISGFDLLQAARFQGTADNADTVDYFHMAEEKYKYETTQNRPTAGADWCIKISTPVWNSTSETIYLTAEGDNTRGTVILKTGSRQNNWWGYATNYNGTGIIGVYKLVSDSDDVYIKVNSAYTSVRIRTTFKPTISIPTAIPDYNFTNVPYQGGFFSNAIYTDTLTFTTPKYWANIPISDNSNTGTQPTFNTAYVSNWWRSTGNTGWWNETHLGGITMEDDSYVKVAGNKSFLIPNGSLKIGGNGNIFFATGDNDATLKIYGQTNTKYGSETIAIQTCFDNQDPQTSGHTTQYASRCNLLLQPRGGQVYIGKNLTTVGDTGYKLLVDGNQWTSGSQWVNGNLLFTDITGNTADTGMSLKGVYGRIGGNDGWRIAGGARANNVGYLEIATCDNMNEPIYVRQYGGGGNWNGYVSLARTFTLLDAAGRSRAPELFEAKKVHVNSLSDQSVAIADIGYQFQVTGTSNFTGSVDISGVTTHHNNIQIDANYSVAKPGKSSAWNGSHNNAMIRMTSVNSWSPLLAQKVTNGYWVLGHYDYNNEKNKNDDFRDQWVFGYLADSNLEGTTGASNSLTTTYRLLNIGDQRMFVSAKYNAAVGSGTQPVYVQSNGNVATCSYSLSATIEAGTANRMAYYKAANQIAAAGHYVSSYQVGINATSVDEAYSFFVGGDSYFSGNVSALKKIYIGPNGVGGYLNGAATNGGCNSIMVGDDVWLGNINQSGIMGVKSTGSQAGFWFYNSGSTNIGKLYINSSKHLVIDNMLVNSASISVSGGGNYNYCKLATIKISSTYLNRPISFEIGGRGKQNSVISIMFSNTANSDPGLSYFTTNCENCFYIKKTATSTWEVYGNYSESWGTFLINRVYGEGLTVQGISVTWNMENISALPANSTRVSYGYHVNYADSASNADMVDGYHAARLWRSDGAIWDPNANVKLNASANNQEWSFDITRNGKTGCYWHVWDSTLSTMLKVNADDGKVSAPYNFVGKLEGVAKTLARSGDLNNAMTFNWSGQGGQPTWLWGGNDGVNMYVYNPSNFTVAKAGWLNKNTSLTYGANGLQYFDNYTDVTTGPTANANPEKDWYHIIRMNHANQGGYFVDLAICFHSDTFSYRRIVNGTDKGWVRLIDSSNISSQSVNYAASAGKLTTNAGSATKPIYFANGVPVQCNDTLGNNISGNAATATNADTTDGVHLEWSGSQAASATEWLAGWTSDGKKIKAIKRSDLETKNADTVDNYHAASFFIHDRLTATSTTGDDGLWGLTGSRSFHGALPEGLSNIYSYGQLISFSTDNSARLQIYAAHTGSADSILSYRTGWGTDKKTWRTFIDSGNIGKQSVNYSNSTGYVRSLGNQAPETGRTAARGGVYTYNMYDQTANGAPGTYLSVVGFGNGAGGHIEIAGQWTGNSNLWMRGLRDCCDDWYSWNRIWCQGNSVTGAVWNDYAECRQSDCNEPGRVVFEKGDDTLTKTEKRLQHFAGVISDTWGFSQGETDKAKTNIAVAGRVLVYTYQDRNNYKPGDCVCAAPNGTIDIMTREEIIKFPDRIVGTVSCVPDYEEWGGGKNADRDPVKVNDRIWIKVK
jgi:hypothetical protein